MYDSVPNDQFSMLLPALQADKINREYGKMARATAFVVALTPDELYDRRLAVESTIGTMRLENMKPDETAMQILNSYQLGRISIEELSRLLHEYSSTIR